ncbi:low affinity immunoglobulin epsilon Fc receptor [Heteronotia binoei]|uniref:low affinity immunoglobulin epsilon Fc receptor n=1 Tax=Heteronotia binoei TaxID=13085 RepID=UPI002931D0D2|nr:low affinity immunoglobulin epsilon Fc receptor [Heteronotia binoei]
MAPGSIYMKCEEPDTVELKDNAFHKTSRRPGAFRLQCCRCCSEETSISVLYIASAVLFLLWIITTIFLTAKYSKMAKELEQLHGNQTLLSANDIHMEKQLDILHSSQSTYASQMNNSLKRLEDHQTKLKQNMTKELFDLYIEEKNIWDELFKLGSVLHKLNASACKMCPEGWHLNRGQCYYFHEESMHWSLAEKFCDDQGGHLVVINDNSEQAFLESKKKVSSYWIGLHDMKSENMFIWVNDSPLKYSHWFPGEPNDYGHGEDCVMMQNNGYWNDYGCGNEVAGSICEKPWNCQ